MELRPLNLMLAVLIAFVSGNCPSNFVFYNGWCYPFNGFYLNGQQVFASNCTIKCDLQAVIPSPLCPSQPLIPEQPLPPTQTIPPLQPMPPGQQPNLPCPNQPIPPIQVQPPGEQQPSQPSQPCPNQPIPPIQIVPPGLQPSLPPGQQPSSPCPNQPIPPIQIVPPGQQPSSPYPNQPIPPIQIPPPGQQPSPPCPNEPIPPIQIVPPGQQPSPPCPNQPIPPIQLQPPGQPPYTQQPTESPVTDTTSTMPTPTPTPTPTQPPQPTTTTPIPPPAEIMKCPDGTILMNGSCRIIYCGKGTYSNGRCEQAVCPTGTVWTGLFCAPPKPIEYPTITFNNTIYNKFNNSISNIVHNNVENVYLNLNTTVPLVTMPDDETSDEYDENDADDDDLTPTTIAPLAQKCCVVKSPRTCKQNVEQNRWNCYSRSYKRCGDFCLAPIIYLTPPRVQQNDTIVVVPPLLNMTNCNEENASCPPTEVTNRYDCSGCALGQGATCAKYCYQYHCACHNCNFYDQKDYCTEFPGESGCQQEDGCFDDWCG